jgi:fused signal recognition particle receptor
MDELAKVGRVAERETPGGIRETLLVLDSVTGQNGFTQADIFNKSIPLSGVVLTKFDNTAKGGIVLSISRRLRLPIRYIGLGEGAADMELFSSRDFVHALLGMEHANACDG